MENQAFKYITIALLLSILASQYKIAEITENKIIEICKKETK